MFNRKSEFVSWLGLILVITVMSGCSNKLIIKDGSSSLNNNQVQVNTLGDVASGEVNLDILDGCVGCGNCVRIDSEHFEINVGSRIAQVKSQDNLESSLIVRAIKSCRPQVITLSKK